MSDHARRASEHIEWAHDQQSRDGEYDHSVRDNATLAVAEATLYLAEQQRIANIIAWTTATPDGYSPSDQVAREIVQALWP